MHTQRRPTQSSKFYTLNVGQPERGDVTTGAVCGPQNLLRLNANLRRYTYRILSSMRWGSQLFNQPFDQSSTVSYGWLSIQLKDSAVRCPDIERITFSQRSQQAIEEIRKVDRFTMMLQRVTAGGVVMNIFAGNGPIETTYSLASTDFAAMAKAMSAMPEIARRRISNIAQESAFYTSSSAEKIFWNAVVDGCRP